MTTQAPTVPSTQKALVIERLQGGFVLKETKVSTPKAGELLVKIHSGALNPVDYAKEKFGFFVTEWPVIVGQDIAGDVVDVGEGVTQFEGLFSSPYASFQQYTLVEAALAAKIPDNITYDKAATIPLMLITSYLAMYHKLSLTPPTPTHGGAGKYRDAPFVVIGAIQLAKLSGFSPIITYASVKHEDFLKSLGATHVIDHQTAPIMGVGCDLKPDTQQAGYDLLGKGGKLAIVLFPSETLKKEDGSGKEVTHIIAEWVRNGIVKPNRVEVLPDGLGGYRTRSGPIGGQPSIRCQARIQTKRGLII
ncbi:hypothetical protein AX16_006289 [Volvariella volvacea WC 439]|nr:hypothetical protein AX16_006289 [Volvariella volvacea WC 439]